MTNYLRAIPGQSIRWPYGLQQLADDVLQETGSFVSINAKVELFEAAPFYLFSCEILPAPEPSDPRTRRVTSAEPERGKDGIWRQGWTERDATADEIAFFDQLNAPEPQWVQFAGALAMQPSVNALVATAAQAAPVLHLQLGVGLGQAAQGNPATFLAAWQAGMTTGLITPELAAEVAALAAPFSLPNDFLQGLTQ